MDLRQMEVVVAVAEEGGFSAAARRLHVVQSAVSTTVQSLERELGTPLFHRTTHRVSLTPAGEAFLPAARATLQAAQQARTAVDPFKDALRGEITVGVMQGLFTGLAQALADFHREYPAVTVRLRQAPVGDIPQTLRDGSLDLAVVALDTPQLRGLTTRLLAQEDMVLVTGPATGAPPALRPVTLPEAARLPLVDFPPGWAIRHEVDKAFRSASLERATTFEVNDVLAATDLVRHGLGVCIMPPSLASRFPDLPVRPFAGQAPAWTVRVVQPQGQTPPAVAALLRHIT
ncbi:LysR family transcriptional regulator [Streptomyces sp. NPDC003753]|uniref:LysR family transcriptional regulator n=1 Tax=Streptomyces sp. Y2F8-2 TaxID=2759675 RepID=UPI0019049916|nr:LysR family transcriptional regulator [Streptomyces sp. Y2F8-2]GHK05129.1 LysR family transcriptional regulator [Streptomyces sp. Y2F8-2]